MATAFAPSLFFGEGRSEEIRKRSRVNLGKAMRRCLSILQRIPLVSERGPQVCPRRISKRGRSLLRKILYYAAMQTIRKNGIMHEYYTRLTGRGMKSMMALVAVSRKLLRIIHAILRDEGEYVVNYESVKRQVIKKAA